MNGWFRVHRDIFNHDIFEPAPMSEREAWIWLISKAAWKDTRHRVGNTMHDVPRGSMFVTIRELQEAWGWKSTSKVAAFLDLLRKENMIRTEAGTGKTHLTICNYSKFQDVPDEENTTKEHQKNAKNTRAEQEQNTKEEDKQVKNIIDISNDISSLSLARDVPGLGDLRDDPPAVPKRLPEPGKPAKPKDRSGTRLPEDWQPSEVDCAYAAAKGMARPQILHEAEKFAAYWLAKAGKDGRKSDWGRAWQSWILRAIDSGPRGQGPPRMASPPQDGMGLLAVALNPDNPFHAQAKRQLKDQIDAATFDRDPFDPRPPAPNERRGRFVAIAPS